jgi:hypothetical protein
MPKQIMAATISLLTVGTVLGSIRTNNILRPCQFQQGS